MFNTLHDDARAVTSLSCNSWLTRSTGTFSLSSVSQRGWPKMAEKLNMLSFLPSKLRSQLLPFQREGVKYAIEKDGRCVSLHIDTHRVNSYFLSLDWLNITPVWLPLPIGVDHWVMLHFFFLSFFPSPISGVSLLSQELGFSIFHSFSYWLSCSDSQTARWFMSSLIVEIILQF